MNDRDTITFAFISAYVITGLFWPVFAFLATLALVL